MPYYLGYPGYYSSAVYAPSYSYVCSRPVVQTVSQVVYPAYGYVGGYYY